MSRKVFVVIQSDPHEGNQWVEGVFATVELAQAYITTQETELAENDMEGSYEFDIKTSFLVEE
jgi:hypothetical protein